MRAPLIALTVMMTGVPPALAQEGSGKPLDLVFTEQALMFEYQELVFETGEIGGAVQSLQILEDENEIRIQLSADVLFDFDKDEIRQEAEEALAEAARILRENPELGVRIEGHTDAKGTDSYNQLLSEKRAESVKNWLVSKEGLKASNYTVLGLGEKMPVAANSSSTGADDPAGRQKNRRVEIVIVKK